MRIMPSWGNFKSKYPSEELQRAKFEDLARCLFCERFNICYGIFQCINHAGNETDVITLDGETIGFQAKFFSHEINAEEIIRSIETARIRHPEQTKVIIYTNQTFGNPQKGKEKTSKQEKIEGKAKDLNLQIEWSSDKMILDQVAHVNWIYDLFFGTEPNLFSLIEEENSNTQSMLIPIQSQIQMGDKSLKVDRENVISQLCDGIGTHNHFVLHGEGGTGKTAIIKDLFKRFNGEIPICIRKAQSLNVKSSSDFFRLTNSYSTEQFENAFCDSDKKVFVIDSAEKIQEIGDTNPLAYLIHMLDKDGWTIIFTVRNVYLNDLKDELRYTYSLDSKFISVDSITEDELADFTRQLAIMLPEKESFVKRLCNLFYLNLYIRYYNSIDQKETFDSFFRTVWREKITGKRTSSGINLKREACFEEIIKKRTEFGCFYIDKKCFDSEALQELINDEVIGITSRGIFIAHDIFEEWGVNHFMSSAWMNKIDIPDFFANIGSSYLVRRTFRQWLSNEIEERIESVQSMIHLATSYSIEPFWRDEIIVSILHSSYCSKFLIESEKELFANDSSLLKRIVFLLQLACKQFDKIITIEGNDYPIYTPCGLGWQSVIAFLYQHKEKTANIKYLLNVISDWSTSYHRGSATRYSGLIALYIWAKSEDGETHFFDDTYTNKLSQVICNAAIEIKDELNQLISKVVSHQWFHHNSPYYYLSLYILTCPKYSWNLICSVPDSVMKLAKAFWIDVPEEKEDFWTRSLLDSEVQYGIRENDFKNGYSPAGAYQSPMYYLLCISPAKAIQFLVEIVNCTIGHYATRHSDSDNLEEITIHLQDGKKTTQWGSASLWEIYRGAVQLVMPDLLQSIHMALEKYLLDLMEKENIQLVESMFDYILRYSKSVSLTAVIASIVTAYPEILWKYALILFKTLELFKYDNMRCMNESLHNSFLGLDALQDKDVVEERIISMKLNFRKEHLESTCVRYQYFRTTVLSENDSSFIVDEIHQIIDQHFSTLQSLPHEKQDVVEILLYRIDRRKHNPKVSNEDGRMYIELSPQLPDVLRNKSEQSMAYNQRFMRFSSLLTWAYLKFRNEDASVYKDYEADPHNVIITIKDLIEAVNNDESLLPLDYYSQFAAAGILVRDFSRILSKDDLAFCAQLVENRIISSLENTYYPQMSDGLECCVHAIPQMLILFPEKSETYKRYLLTILLNRAALGAYKRICDYAIETIHECNLWEKNPSFMETLFNDYIFASTCKAQSVVEDKEKQNRRIHCRGESLFSKLKAWKLKHKQIHDNQSILDTESIIDIEGAEILLELMPADTKNPRLIDVVLRQILPIMLATLKRDRHSSYYRHMHFYKAFVRFVLYRPIGDIDEFVIPVLDRLDGDSNSENLLLQFIWMEDNLMKVDAFWRVWSLLYDTIKVYGSRYGGRLMLLYMFASGKSLVTGQKWHSFRQCDTWLFSALAKECGNSPAVFYSIAKSLTGIASHYMVNGLDWLCDIINVHSDIELGDKEANTVVYMEMAMNKYVRQNRMAIKQDNLLRRKVIDILSFMVERNSVQGYMLRELIV